MAQLDVQPKKKTNLWWVWLLLVLAAIALIYFLSQGNNKSSDVTACTDSTNNAMHAARVTSGVAAPQPGWSGLILTHPKHLILT